LTVVFTTLSHYRVTERVISLVYLYVSTLYQRPTDEQIDGPVMDV